MSKYIIETKNLTKQYGTQKSVASLNIHVQKGRIYGLLGRNGAGKTTTMKMLLGLASPTSGEVMLWGKPLKNNEKKLLPRIGSLIESPGFYPNLTATENLRIFAALRGVPNKHAIKDALDLVGLPYKDKKLFSQYSLGMKQRLAIALAVILAFVYGYGGMFAAGNMTLANIYPITASMGLIQYRSYDTAVHWNTGLCSLSMVVVLLVSMAIVATTKNVSSMKTTKKAKKTTPKKGW